MRYWFNLILDITCKTSCTTLFCSLSFHIFSSENLPHIGRTISCGPAIGQISQLWVDICDLLFFFSFQWDGNKLLRKCKWLQASYKGGTKKGNYSTKGKHLGKYPFHFSCSWVMPSISLKKGEGRIQPQQCRVVPEAIQPVSPTSPPLGPPVRCGLGGLAAETLASKLQSADVPCAFSPGPGRWK